MVTFVQGPARFADYNLRLPPDAMLSVSDYYRKHLAARRMQRLSRETIGTDWTCLRRWERLGSAALLDWTVDQFGRREPLLRLTNDGQPVLIDDPPIGLIVDDDVMRFQSALLEEVEATTANTTLRTIDAVFQAAAPRTDRRSGRNDLFRLPYWEPLDELESGGNWIPDADQVSAFLLTATRHARWPVKHNISPSAWWQALIVFLVNYGLRCGDWKRLCFGANLDRDITRLIWCPKKTKRKKTTAMTLPINAATQSSMLPIRNHDALVLSGPVFYSSGSRKNFDAEWKRLLSLCRLDMTEIRRDRKSYLLFDRHALRRFCNCWLNDHFDGFPGEWVLGHGVKSRSNVNLHSYSRPVHDPPQYVVDAIMNCPQIDAVQTLLR